MKSITLKLPDMSCEGCVDAVRSALSHVDGVQEAGVSLDEKTATVLGEDDVSTDALLAAAKAAGYSASIEE